MGNPPLPASLRLAPGAGGVARSAPAGHTVVTERARLPLQTVNGGAA